MDEIRNQFKSQTLSTLKASSINTVGGRVFPDAPAITDLEAFKAVVQSWQGVHAPTYAQPIAGTNQVTSGTGQGTILSTSNSNEVYRIDAIFLNNSGSGLPLTAYVRLDTCPLNSMMASFDNATISPGENAQVKGPFFMDSQTPMNIIVTDGNRDDLEWFVKWSKIVQ